MCALIANPNTTPRTIVVTSFAGIDDEAPAGGTIKPGQAIVKNSAGAVVVQAVEGADDLLQIAKEPVLSGAGSTGFVGGGSIDTAYASADNVYYRIPQPGEKFLGYCKSGSGAGYTYAVGDKLIFDGAGNFKRVGAASTTTVVKKIVAIVETALDLAANPGDTRTVLRAC